MGSGDVYKRQIVTQHKDHYESFNIYFQDESRFGLFTRNGKSITTKGIKPICPFIQDFKNTYLFGAFSRITGNSLLLDMPYCNTNLQNKRRINCFFIGCSMSY